MRKECAPILGARLIARHRYVPFLRDHTTHELDNIRLQVLHSEVRLCPPVWMLRMSIAVPMVLLVVWAVAFPAVDVAMAQDPLGAGPPFLISSPSGHDQYPAVAYNPTRHTFLVVWKHAGGAISGGTSANRGR